MTPLLTTVYYWYMIYMMASYHLFEQIRDKPVVLAAERMRAVRNFAASLKRRRGSTGKLLLTGVSAPPLASRPQKTTKRRKLQFNISDVAGPRFFLFFTSSAKVLCNKRYALYAQHCSIIAKFSV